MSSTGAGTGAAEGLFTVMFTDIQASTDLVATRGDTTARAIFLEHEELVSAALAKHSGRLVRRLGDGMLSVFPSCRRAASCALEIQSSVDEHGRASPDKRFRLRIGLSVGEVVEEQGEIYGAAVHSAARITSIAEPGGILASETVRQLIGPDDSMSWEDKGRVELKGFPDPVRVFALHPRAAEQGLRIQLCGSFAVELAGQRLDPKIPGKQGKLLFAYLVINDDRPIARDELVEAVWGGEAVGPDVLNPVISKLRKALGPDRIQGRAEIRFVSDESTLVDAAWALNALHGAESFADSSDWARVWSLAHSAYHVAKRPFMLGHEAPWIDEWRRRLSEVRDRGLSLFAESALKLGGTALGPAERAARSLMDAAPFNETGYRVLMETLETRGNRAEALLVYDRLKRLLRDELGVDPSPTTQEVYLRLLG